MEPITYVLFGHTDRDRDELVCQFFPNQDERDQFVASLPGTYETMSLIGVDCNQFTVEVEGSYDVPQCVVCYAPLDPAVDPAITTLGPRCRKHF